MGIPYKTKQFLWPPRPDSAIPPDMLESYADRGWICQYKKNGTCSIIFVSPNKEVSSLTRHNEEHKMWEPTAKSSEPFTKLPGNGWYVFVAEVLHSKVKGIKDTVYIFDVLVNDGDYLVSTTQEKRQSILWELFGNSVVGETYSHHIISDNVWLVKNLTGNFKDMFNAIKNDEDEGLVLKNPKALLNVCHKISANAAWQVKCRKGHKNFGF